MASCSRSPAKREKGMKVVQEKASEYVQHHRRSVGSRDKAEITYELTQDFD
jgi:hypothetical protein